VLALLLSASVAGELVTVPALLVTVTEYWPTSAAVTAASSRLSPVAPATSVPLNAHWNVTPPVTAASTENDAKSPALTS
jgi:hypothetical protein